MNSKVINLRKPFIIFIFISIFVAGCNREIKADKSNENAVNYNATSKEDQVEYLVVSFGKVEYGGIVDNIRNGNSKLVAFQEFSNLLSGYEGIDIQTKLDMLGRFGWNLVNTVGAIGGDQEYIFKRKRIEDRNDLEQKTILKLSKILKEESLKREEMLRKLQDELGKMQQNGEAASKEFLVEMDYKEKLDRENKAKELAIDKIKSMFLDSPNSYLENTTINSLNVNVDAKEDDDKRIDYSGKIEIDVDATKALIFDVNKYRASQADVLLNKYLKQVFYVSKIPMHDTTLGDFRINLKLYILFNGKKEYVANTSRGFNMPGYKGYWSY
jgi:hypothetical protein